MRNPLLMAVVFQLVGIAVILSEIILPSGGILTLAAVGSFAYSIFLVFSHSGQSAGMWVVIADAVLVPVLVVVAIRVLGKTSASLHLELGRDKGVVSQEHELAKLVGGKGTVVNSCRPAGRAEISGKRYDVVSSGDFIDKGSRIIVQEVDGNRIVVNILPE